MFADIAATKPASGTPDGMVKIPEGTFTIKVHGIEIEGFNDIGVDVQYAVGRLRRAVITSMS